MRTEGLTPKCLFGRAVTAMGRARDAKRACMFLGRDSEARSVHDLSEMRTWRDGKEERADTKSVCTMDRKHIQDTSFQPRI